MDRLRRAWRFMRPIDFWHSIAPSVIAAGAVAGGSWWLAKNDKQADMSYITYPLLSGLAAFLGALLILHGGEFLYRFITGKAPKGSARTLYGIVTRSLEECLRASAMIFPTIVVAQDTIEVLQFANEICDLLTRCGWQCGDIGIWRSGTRDVEIRLPDGGNAGLVALSDLLNRCGYKAVVMPDQGSSTAQIVIGEASP